MLSVAEIDLIDWKDPMQLRIETPYFSFSLRLGRVKTVEPEPQTLTSVPAYRAREAKIAALQAVPEAEVTWTISADSRRAVLRTHSCSREELKAMRSAIQQVRKKPYDW